jgi:hypothetical protein
MCSETGGMRRFYDGHVEDVRPRATGRCLCGAVTYEVRGPLRDVILCHCEECRRWSGYLGAFTATRTEHLHIAANEALRWIESPESDRHARRSFCSECGSSLFWQAAGAQRVSIAAGTLDQPTGLRAAAHIYVHQVAEHDVLPDDGLPRRDADTSSLDVRWS